MTQLNFFSGIAIEGSALVPVGKQILWRDGQVVWCGTLGAPTEDVEYDRMTVNPGDFEQLTHALSKAEPTR